MPDDQYWFYLSGLTWYYNRGESGTENEKSFADFDALFGADGKL